MLERADYVKCKMIEKSSQKLLIQYTIIIIDGFFFKTKSYVVKQQKHSLGQMSVPHVKF